MSVVTINLLERSIQMTMKIVKSPSIVRLHYIFTMHRVNCEEYINGGELHLLVNA